MSRPLHGLDKEMEIKHRSWREHTKISFTLWLQHVEGCGKYSLAKFEIVTILSSKVVTFTTITHCCTFTEGAVPPHKPTQITITGIKMPKSSCLSRWWKRPPCEQGTDSILFSEFYYNGYFQLKMYVAIISIHYSNMSDLFYSV